MLRTPVSSIFVLVPKIDNIAMVMLHCIAFEVIFTHSPCLDFQESSWQEKKLYFKRTISEITHLWACDKTIFRTGIPTQRK